MVRLFLLALLLSAGLWAGETQRYIVELDGEPAAAREARSPGAERSSASLRILRSEVWREQDVIARILQKLGADPVHRLDTLVNGIVVEARPRVAAQLARLDGVKAVHRVGVVEAAMNRAIDLHEIDRAWWWTGGEDSGRGVKIAIIDSGIDTAHPGFEPNGLEMPPGYPLGNTAADLALTTRKVIAYRSYETLFPEEKRGGSEDCGGHGTSVAMCAAGARVSTPVEPISGVAPGAFIGAYKVFPSCRDRTGTDVVLHALEDAVRDGMDVLNLSLGHAPGERPEADILQRAVDRAVSLGILVVSSAGNEGPMPGTLGGSGKFGAASLDVGASMNDRFFTVTATVAGTVYAGLLSDVPAPDAPIVGPLMDVSRLDDNGQACGELPAGSLEGMIALILRGGCNFDVKHANAQAAGAVGALVYSDDREPTRMGTGGATLPSMMITNAEGLAIRAQFPPGGTLDAKLDFSLTAMPVDDQQIVGFSSRGPGPAYLIKPDVVAIGGHVYTAESQHAVGTAGHYGSTGGTSFSSPIVAGAAAVLKAARPQLNPRQMMSLLVNNADLIQDKQGRYLDVMHQGAGRLNFERAVRGTLAASPVSVTFGANPTAKVERRMLLTNLGIFPDTFAVSVESFSAGPSPTVTPAALDLTRGQSAWLTVAFDGSGLPPGTYQGVVRVRGSRPNADIHIPYWLGVGTGVPISFTKYEDDVEDEEIVANSEQEVWLRINDEYGIAVTSQLPEVNVQNGNGEVLDVRFDTDVNPDLVIIDYKLGDSQGWHCIAAQIGELATTECFWLE